MNPLEFLKRQAKEYKQGFKTADAIQIQMAQKAKKTKGLGYGESVLDPRFKAGIAAAGISARETPAQFLGAYTSRLLIDVANDGTRTYWWRWNHPLAIAQRVTELGVQGIDTPTGRAVAALGVAVPAVAAAGTYDITNPEEYGRPKGFAQRYSPVGADDRRQTAQPAQEIFERFFLQRTGDPLKYETAKQDIPSLTPQRYANYMNFLYQDKGLLGLGIVKGTGENLQGYPEARVLGFPVSIPMTTGFVAGSVGANLAAATAKGSTPKQRAIRGAIGALAGSLTGVAGGNAINEAIASGNRPQLPTTAEYEMMGSDRI
jgi:hypothetical protein